VYVADDVGLLPYPPLMAGSEGTPAG